MKNQTTTRKWGILVIVLLTLNLGTLAQEAFGVASLSGLNNTQDISKLPKMERDIIILQNVLNDLFNGGSRIYSSTNRGAKGIYVPGKGVIFNIGASGNEYEFLIANELASGQNGNGQAKQSEDQSAAEKNKERETRLKELSKEFLVNYGSILSELKAGEKVMLNVNYTNLRELKSNENSGVTISGGSSVIYRSGNRIDKKRMVSAIDYEIIDSYLSGKTTLQSAESKISQSILEADAKTSQDAKIMAGILDDLFQSNFDGIYRRSGKTSWTYFEGFGLMYDLNLTGARGNLRFASASNVVVTGVRSAEQDAKDPKQEEANKKIEENYDDLIELVKESLVTYGRTLRSVKSDEVVILNINFGSAFRKTKVPRAVRLQVTKSQIEAFSKGQKSLEQLKKEIDIKRLSASTSSFNGHYDSHNFPGGAIYETAPHPEDHPVEIAGHLPAKKKSN